MTSSVRIPTHEISKYRKSFSMENRENQNVKPMSADAYQFIITRSKKIQPSLIPRHVFFCRVLESFYLSAWVGVCVCYVLTCTNRLLERTHELNDKARKQRARKLHTHTHTHTHTHIQAIFDKPFEINQTNFRAWISLLALHFLSLAFFVSHSFDFCFALYFSTGFKFPSNIVKCFRNTFFLYQCIDIEGVFESY